MVARDVSTCLLVASILNIALGTPSGPCPRESSSSTTLLLPDTVDCSIYYSCSSGDLVLKTCPTGLVFDPGTQSCRAPSSTGCQTPGIQAGQGVAMSSLDSRQDNTAYSPTPVATKRPRGIETSPKPELSDVTQPVTDENPKNEHNSSLYSDYANTMSTKRASLFLARLSYTESDILDTVKPTGYMTQSLTSTPPYSNSGITPYSAAAVPKDNTSPQTTEYSSEKFVQETKYSFEKQNISDSLQTYSFPTMLSFTDQSTDSSNTPFVAEAINTIPTQSSAEIYKTSTDMPLVDGFPSNATSSLFQGGENAHYTFTDVYSDRITSGLYNATHISGFNNQPTTENFINVSINAPAEAYTESSLKENIHFQSENQPVSDSVETNQNRLYSNLSSEPTVHSAVTLSVGIRTHTNGVDSKDSHKFTPMTVTSNNTEISPDRLSLLENPIQTEKVTTIQSAKKGSVLYFNNNLASSTSNKMYNSTIDLTTPIPLNLTLNSSTTFNEAENDPTSKKQTVFSNLQNKLQKGPLNPFPTAHASYSSMISPNKFAIVTPYKFATSAPNGDAINPVNQPVTVPPNLPATAAPIQSVAGPSNKSATAPPNMSLTITPSKFATVFPYKATTPMNQSVTTPPNQPSTSPNPSATAPLIRSTTAYPNQSANTPTNQSANTPTNQFATPLTNQSAKGWTIRPAKSSTKLSTTDSPNQSTAAPRNNYTVSLPKEPVTTPPNQSATASPNPFVPSVIAPSKQSAMSEIAPPYQYVTVIRNNYATGTPNKDTTHFYKSATAAPDQPAIDTLNQSPTVRPNKSVTLLPNQSATTNQNAIFPINLSETTPLNHSATDSTKQFPTTLSNQSTTPPPNKSATVPLNQFSPMLPNQSAITTPYQSTKASPNQFVTYTAVPRNESAISATPHPNWSVKITLNMYSMTTNNKAAFPFHRSATDSQNQPVLSPANHPVTLLRNHYETSFPNHSEMSSNISVKSLLNHLQTPPPNHSEPFLANNYVTPTSNHYVTHIPNYSVAHPPYRSATPPYHFLTLPNHSGTLSNPFVTQPNLSIQSSPSHSGISPTDHSVTSPANHSVTLSPNHYVKPFPNNYVTRPPNRSISLTPNHNFKPTQNHVLKPTPNNSLTLSINISVMPLNHSTVTVPQNQSSEAPPNQSITSPNLSVKDLPNPSIRAPSNQSVEILINQTLKPPSNQSVKAYLPKSVPTPLIHNLTAISIQSVTAPRQFARNHHNISITAVPHQPTTTPSNEFAVVSTELGAQRSLHFSIQPETLVNEDVNSKYTALATQTLSGLSVPSTTITLNHTANNSVNFKIHKPSDLLFQSATVTPNKDPSIISELGMHTTQFSPVELTTSHPKHFDVSFVNLSSKHQNLSVNHPLVTPDSLDSIYIKLEPQNHTNLNTSFSKYSTMTSENAREQSSAYISVDSAALSFQSGKSAINIPSQNYSDMFVETKVGVHSQRFSDILHLPPLTQQNLPSKMFTPDNQSTFATHSMVASVSLLAPENYMSKTSTLIMPSKALATIADQTIVGTKFQKHTSTNGVTSDSSDARSNHNLNIYNMSRNNTQINYTTNFNIFEQITSKMPLEMSRATAVPLNRQYARTTKRTAALTTIDRQRNINSTFEQKAYSILKESAEYPSSVTATEDTILFDDFAEIAPTSYFTSFINSIINGLNLFRNVLSVQDVYLKPRSYSMKGSHTVYHPNNLVTPSNVPTKSQTNFSGLSSTMLPATQNVPKYIGPFSEATGHRTNMEEINQLKISDPGNKEIKEVYEQTDVGDGLLKENVVSDPQKDMITSEDSKESEKENISNKGSEGRLNKRWKSSRRVKMSKDRGSNEESNVSSKNGDSNLERHNKRGKVSQQTRRRKVSSEESDDTSEDSESSVGKYHYRKSGKFYGHVKFHKESDSSEESSDSSEESSDSSEDSDSSD